MSHEGLGREGLEPLRGPARRGTDAAISPGMTDIKTIDLSRVTGGVSFKSVGTGMMNGALGSAQRIDRADKAFWKWYTAPTYL